MVFCPSPSYWCCECHQGHCSLRLPVTFMSLRSPSFLVSMRSSTECLVVGFSVITWVRNLSVFPRNALDACLSLDKDLVLSFLQIPGWFKSFPMRTGPVIVRLLLPGCRGPYPLDFLARCPVADALSLQCHHTGLLSNRCL